MTCCAVLRVHGHKQRCQPDTSACVQACQGRSAEAGCAGWYRVCSRHMSGRHLSCKTQLGSATTMGGDGSLPVLLHLLMCVLRGVQVDQTGDVIEFYNAVFIPATKAFLLQLGNGSANLLPLPTLTLPGTPLHGRLGSNPYRLATPPPPDRATINKCLSPAGKVFVSPLRLPGQQVVHFSSLLHSTFLSISQCHTYVT